MIRRGNPCGCPDRIVRIPDFILQDTFMRTGQAQGQPLRFLVFLRAFVVRKLHRYPTRLAFMAYKIKPAICS
jgi:hypothetical protein